MERAYELAQDLAMRRAFASVYSGALETFIATREVQLGFARYAGPVLCAWGAKDRYIPVGALHDVMRVYPSAATLILDSSGHLPMLEETDRLGITMRAFLRQRPINEEL